MSYRFVSFVAEGGVEVTDRLVAVLSPDDDLYWFNLIGLDQFSHQVGYGSVKKALGRDGG